MRIRAALSFGQYTQVCNSSRAQYNLRVFMYAQSKAPQLKYLSACERDTTIHRNINTRSNSSSRWVLPVVQAALAPRPQHGQDDISM